MLVEELRHLLSSMKHWHYDVKKNIIERCKSHPFTLGTDGSSDTGLEEMNPTMIKIFDVKQSKTITTHFFDMCLMSGND